eukprot:scaffold14011_cov122-Isochrysis_galbana.AAC.2
MASVHDGATPVTSKLTRSHVPPAILRKGRISARTPSMPSSDSCGPSGVTCSTATISGIFSRNPRSRPIFMVMAELAHEPQAPCSSSRTMPPSISAMATLPPSAIRYGRISSSTRSTFSLVSGRGPTSAPLRDLAGVLASKGETMEASVQCTTPARGAHKAALTAISGSLSALP